MLNKLVHFTMSCELQTMSLQLILIPNPLETVCRLFVDVFTFASKRFGTILFSTTTK